MDGLNMVNHMLKQNKEEKLWQLYVETYPHMNKENFLTFEDFKKKVMKPTSTISNSGKFVKATEEEKERIYSMARCIKERSKSAEKGGQNI